MCIRDRVKATSNYFHNLVINGVAASTGAGYVTGTFDGLRKLLAGTSNEFTTDIDLSDSAKIGSNANAFIDQLDQLVHSIDGDTTMLMMNSDMLLKRGGLCPPHLEGESYGTQFCQRRTELHRQRGGRRSSAQPGGCGDAAESLPRPEGTGGQAEGASQSRVEPKSVFHPVDGVALYAVGKIEFHSSLLPDGAGRARPALAARCV